MKIIDLKEFKVFQKVRLNKGGKVIGRICSFRGKLVYISRRKNIHYFIKFGGFGIDRTLLKKMVIPNPKDPDNIFNRIDLIIIFYNGPNEKRFYSIEPEEFFMKGIPYGTAKEVDKEVQSYGEQLILPQAAFKLIGFRKDDHEIKRRVRRIKTWDRYYGKRY